LTTAPRPIRLWDAGLPEPEREETRPANTRAGSLRVQKEGADETCCNQYAMDQNALNITSPLGFCEPVGYSGARNK
jgi:hypothetical protein